MRPWSWLVMGVLLAACDEAPGEEEAPEDRPCPVEERCSPLTPLGLYFVGAENFSRYDPDPAPTAVGGTQRLSLYEPYPLRDPEYPWRAEVDGALEYVSQERNVLTVRGTAEGAATVRIVSAETGELFDRTTLYAYTVADISAVTVGFKAQDPAQPVAWFAGAPIRVGFALTSAVGEWLVDESFSVRVIDGATSVTSSDRWWNVVDIDGTAAGRAGAVTLAVDAGDRRDLPIQLPVVDTVDELVAWPQHDAPIRVGGSEPVCLEGRRGDFTVDGLDWTVEVRGDGWVSPALPFEPPNCWWVNASAPGPLTLIASAAGHTVELTMSVVLPAAGGS